MFSNSEPENKNRYRYHLKKRGIVPKSTRTEYHLFKRDDWLEVAKTISKYTTLSDFKKDNMNLYVNICRYNRMYILSGLEKGIYQNMTLEEAEYLYYKYKKENGSTKGFQREHPYAYSKLKTWNHPEFKTRDADLLYLGILSPDEMVVPTTKKIVKIGCTTSSPKRNTRFDTLSSELDLEFMVFEIKDAEKYSTHLMRKYTEVNIRKLTGKESISGFTEYRAFDEKEYQELLQEIQEYQIGF
jgi:SOS response regulatory protein OraA/RecX